MRLDELVAYLDGYLRIGEAGDYPTALNGLQVENAGEVTRIAAAVDAGEAVIAAAAVAGCDLLLVHHGLFWDGLKPVTGRRYRKLAALMTRGMAVYAAHLPLDRHPEVGNNPALARLLGITVRGSWGEVQGAPIGVWGDLAIGRDALRAKLGEALGGAPVRLIPGGPDAVRTVGVITGGAGRMVAEARDTGLDAFITGEGSHATYHDALELGVNVYLGGHYATETFGVKLLAEHLEARFGLPWTFIDHPSGL